MYKRMTDYEVAQLAKDTQDLKEIVEQLKSLVVAQSASLEQSDVVTAEVVERVSSTSEALETGSRYRRSIHSIHSPVAVGFVSGLAAGAVLCAPLGLAFGGTLLSGLAGAGVGGVSGGILGTFIGVFRS